MKRYSSVADWKVEETAYCGTVRTLPVMDRLTKYQWKS